MQKMSERLSERVVVVTGGAQGIGKATSIRVIEEGGKVAVCDILDDEGRNTTELLRALAKDERRRIDDAANFYHLDVTKEHEVQDVFDRILREMGPIYGLVNNAGIFAPPKSVHLIDQTEWDRVLEVNTKGVFLCTKHAVRQMMAAQSGSIVNISSIYGLVGSTISSPAYHASKGAVRLMTKVDAIHYAKYNIRVNSVHPGFIDTPPLHRIASATGNEKSYIDNLINLHPLGRLGKPEEVAAAIAFLLSNDASFVTGSELVVDGGYVSV